ncbi:MAG: hypothetical protein Q4C64_06115 [Erysipelotrichia bacterium]|nr:hypothetical protein [Erysipelotrichia bacterium]
MKEKLKDYLRVPYEDLKLRQKISQQERAGQFMPFSALVGYEEKIAELCRLTFERAELSEDEKQNIDEALREIIDNIGLKPQIFVCCFEKEIENYSTKIANVQKYDEYKRKLFFTDNSSVNIDDIVKIEII